MANITEELNNPQWAAGIYQLETTDPVLGGPNGIANRQAKELAARTQYLKKKQEEDKPGAASTTKAGIVQLSSATDSNSEELAATPKSVKAAYDKAVESAGKGLPVGAVIGFPRAVTSQEGFLKADGSTFTQATYPDLYRVLGGNRLPNLTHSDIGMTAYFPFGDIPDGWIKYDDISTKVTQAAYPELYRKLVAQYGSIDAVPKAEDRFIRNTAGGLTVGQIQADEIKKHAHKHVSNDNGGSDRIGLRSNYFEDSTDIDPVNFVTVMHDEGSSDNGWITPNGDSPFATGGAETRPKAIAMVLCIKAQNSLDDVVYWIKAFGAVANAGLLDASRLAQGLQDKADKGHTHNVMDLPDISKLLDEIDGLRPKYQRIGDFDVIKLPDGTMIQTGRYTAPTGFIQRYMDRRTLVWAVAFAAGTKPKIWATQTSAAQVNSDAKNNYISTTVDSWVKFSDALSSNTQCVFWAYNQHGDGGGRSASFDFLAIGRWK